MQMYDLFNLFLPYKSLFSSVASRFWQKALGCVRSGEEAGWFGFAMTEEPGPIALILAENEETLGLGCRDLGDKFSKVFFDLVETAPEITKTFDTINLLIIRNHRFIYIYNMIMQSYIMHYNDIIIMSYHI